MNAYTLSIADTVKALGLGRTSVYALINKGRLDVVRIGRRTLVTTESIRRLIDDAKDAPTNGR